MLIEHGGEINGEINLPLLKLEVFPNFRDGQYINFFRAGRGKMAECLRTLDFRFLEYLQLA